MRKIQIIFAIILLQILGGCSMIGKEDEGSIVYEIIFDEQEMKENTIIGLLPTEMTFSFKDQSSKSMIEGFMGMFLTAYISDNNTQTNSILFKVMADKYSCQTQFGQPTLGFDSLSVATITETDEVKDILGLKAHKVKVSFANNEIAPYEAYYTNDIKVYNPNWNNPYKKIDGVFLDYKVKFKGISMHLKAKELKRDKLKDDVFNVPSDYKIVSPQELNSTVDNIMNSAK